jgi:hypothetical protein
MVPWWLWHKILKKIKKIFQKNNFLEEKYFVKENEESRGDIQEYSISSNRIFEIP